MNDFYQKYFQDYHAATFGVDPGSFLTPFAQYLTAGDHILDVGCGSGRDLVWLKKNNFEITGFERAVGLAALARRHAGCAVIEGDFETYDFSKFLYDGVLMCGALVHTPHERLARVVGNIVQGVRENGIVLISLKEGTGSARKKDSRVFYYWQDADLRDVFKRQGLVCLAFHRDVSKVNARDIWLSYTLQKSATDPIFTSRVSKISNEC